MKLSIVLGKVASIICPYNIRRIFQAIHVRYILNMNNNFFKHNCKTFGKNCRIYDISRSGGLKHICIGDNFTIGEMSIIEAIDSHNNETYSPEIVIHNSVSIGRRCHIGCINRIIIEDNVLTGADVLITDHSHGESALDTISVPPEKRKLFSNGPIIIHKNVWIGDKVTILANVTIGENSIIGANSVVTKNIPSNAVACGSPAKVVKYLRGNDNVFCDNNNLQ